MAAIVTVYKEAEDPEAERVLGVLARWAEAADGVTFDRDALVGDVKFSGDIDPGRATTMVEDVLNAADPSWRAHIGLEAVSA